MSRMVEELDMVTRSIASLMLTSAAIVCVSGCRKESHRRNDEVGATSPSTVEPPPSAAELTATRVSGPNAIDQMVEARCARAATCNQVGYRERFDSRAACVRRVRPAMEGMLGRMACPAGIHQRGLVGCLDAIKSEPCEGPLDALDLQACGLSDLCPTIPSPRM